MNFEGHVWSLKLLAGVAYIKTIWGKPEIKAKFIQTCESQEPGSRFDEGEFRAVNNMVIDNIYEEIIPESVKVNVVHVAKEMGRNIYNYVHYLLKTFKLKISSAEAVEWTSIGTIDLIKVVQNWFLKPEIVIINHGAVILMACRCVQVEFIESYRSDIEEYVDRFYGFSREDEVDPFTYMKKTLEYLDNGNPENKPKPEEMLNLAIKFGFFDAAKFYWYETNIIDQQEILYPISIKCYQKCMDLIRSPDQPPLEECREILFFLMSKMSENEKRSFLANKSATIGLILDVWPAQNLFGLFFEEIKSFLTANNYYCVILKILRYLEANLHWDKRLDPTNNFYYQIFLSVWQSFSNNTQEELVIVENNHNDFPQLIMNYFDDFNENLGIPNVQEIFEGAVANQRCQPVTIVEVVEQLLKMFHLQGLKLVLKDKRVEKIKKQLIELELPFFDEIVENENFEALNQFMVEIFDSDEEIKNFKSKLNFYFKLIVKGKYHVAEKLLKWQSDLNNNRKALLMTQINPKKICEYFLAKHEYDKAENFLNWVFETEDEKENFKNEFRSDGYVVERVYDIWAPRGRRDANFSPNFLLNEQMKKPERTLKYLGWVFTDENKINQFKKERLIHSYMCVENFIVIRNGKANNFLDFFSFCEISEKKIKEIKKDLFNDIIRIAINILMEFLEDSRSFFDFSDLDFLFTWSAESEEDKKMAIKNFFNVVGVSKMWNMIKFNFEETENRDGKLKFFNEWIKGSPDLIFELRNVMFMDNNRSPNFYPVINYVCGKLEKGEDVELEDFLVVHYEYSPEHDLIQLLKQFT